MRRSLTGIGLAGSALLGLLLVSGRLAGGSADHPADPAEVRRQLGVADSIADQWVEPYIPLWALTQEAPIIGADGLARATASSAATDCPPHFEVLLGTERVAVRFDSTRMVTELYSRDGAGFVARFNVAADLSYDVDTIPLDEVAPWLVVDLDQDGEVEIVSQFWSTLQIHSAPDWALRAAFSWTGASVSMHPAVVNIDDDPYLELWVTPNTFTGSRAVLIKYDEVADTFTVIADILAPLGAGGEAAIGDFDQDDRMEFIAGYYHYGYSLFEWQDPNLVFIGLVGDTMQGNNFHAAACRPKPGGVLHALLGHSSGGAGLGYRYQLLEPVGDNEFVTAHIFQDYTGFLGAHPCSAADTDCDGLDELTMLFAPLHRVYQWDVGLEDFVGGCMWECAEYGSMVYGHVVDLDQNGSYEWGTLDGYRVFRALLDPVCVFCDATGICDPDAVTCYCYCHAEPKCDGVTNVLDVVSAVDVAFRSAPPYLDPHSRCPYERTDADCDGVTNVIDVVHFVNVAFRNSDPAAEFCAPCP